MNTTKYEHVKFLIERFDHYYESINSKGSFLIGLNTFILSGICAGYISFENKITQCTYSWGLLIFIFGLCLFSILHTIRAISPFTKDNDSNDDTPSLIYFGGIARYELNSFIEKFKSTTVETINEDMYRQVHSLAKGLKAKYSKLSTVSYCLLAEFFLIIFLSIYIIQNFKP